MSTFRKQYRSLTDEQQEHVEQIKDAAERLEQLILDTRFTTPIVNTQSPITEAAHQSRQIALAITNLEQAVMWAVKAAT